MMIEVKIPTPGESINEVELATWLVASGDLVHRNQELAMIESDKATLSLIAPESGKIEILIKEGETVKVNSVACRIDTSVEVPDEETNETEDDNAEKVETVESEETKKESVSVAESDSTQKGTTAEDEATSESSTDLSNVKTTPLARKMMDVENIRVEDIIKGLKRISSDDVNAVLNLPAESTDSQFSLSSSSIERTIEREKMSQLRKHLSKRLVQVKNETAMLTTFNEVDMQNLMNLRKQYQPEFVKKYGYKIGLISFFLKACALALKLHPKVNSQIEGEEILHPSYVDISVAVQSPKGLMVPVIRNVDSLSLADTESELKRLADKAMSGMINMDEMTGGTFTLTNGGVFGSMMSTPLINPPQSAIIGMHNIVDRPMAINGQVEIRPMMYIALSYDHRIIDGKDAVGFLVDVKKMIENPSSMLHGGKQEGKLLLGL
ncbi:MAG: 2-oxoglutarate dehydrogenase complex dihydrolipoyllysine-residue succinyltransferase [Dysgonamonadaceae bacterium]|nr:2-oxoglutarate dehydrogenase complex dihydrolipoyllysine-residue succinyltransferase [Dysgonamonadaceae bacterium]MDD4728445.1 2-oxoglutarate dehydrogenase complex dihydrolipoyllysine-residue succinyltransferase [Dysgonamonadaceae bacterium]